MQKGTVRNALSENFGGIMCSDSRGQSRKLIFPGNRYMITFADYRTAAFCSPWQMTRICDSVASGTILKLTESKMVARQCLQRRKGRVRGDEVFSAADFRVVLEAIVIFY